MMKKEKTSIRSLYDF